MRRAIGVRLVAHDHKTPRMSWTIYEVAEYRARRWNRFLFTGEFAWALVNFKRACAQRSSKPTVEMSQRRTGLAKAGDRSKTPEIVAVGTLSTG